MKQKRAECVKCIGSSKEAQFLKLNISENSTLLTVMADSPELSRSPCESGDSGMGGGAAAGACPQPSPFQPVVAPSMARSSPASAFRKQLTFQAWTWLQNLQVALRAHSWLHACASAAARPPPPSDSGRSPPISAMRDNVQADGNT